MPYGGTGVGATHPRIPAMTMPAQKPEGDLALHDFLLQISLFCNALKSYYTQNRSTTSISYLQGLSIRYLALNKQDVRMSELSAALSTSMSTLSSSVQRLVDKGLVKKSKDDFDERGINLALTEEGLREAHAFFAHARFITDSLAAAYRRQDNHFVNVLTRLLYPVD